MTSTPLKMPDFGTDELAISDLMVLADVQEVASVSPQDPFGAFALGNTRVLPRFGNVFSKDDSVMLLSVAYNGQGGRGHGQGLRHRRLHDLQGRQARGPGAGPELRHPDPDPRGRARSPWPSTSRGDTWPG